jgi:hypothetical protein
VAHVAPPGVACATASSDPPGYGRAMLSRRFLARVLLAPLVATAGLVAGAPPAQAALTGTTSAEDFVLQNNCRNHPVDYAFAVGPGTTLWQVKLSLVAPGGTSSEGVDLSSVDGDATSGTIQFLICGSADPGTYTVRTTGSYQVVAPLANLPVSVAESTFEVRRAATRTKLTKAHLDGNRHRLVATVKDERPRGFKPTKSAEVVFQRRIDGVWRTIRGSRTLTDRGIATAVVTAPAGTRVRAVTKPDGYLGGSTSRSVKLRP